MDGPCVGTCKYYDVPNDEQVIMTPVSPAKDSDGLPAIVREHIDFLQEQLRSGQKQLLELVAFWKERATSLENELVSVKKQRASLVIALAEARIMFGCGSEPNDSCMIEWGNLISAL